MEHKVLTCTAIGALANVGLNLVFIPRLGARAAAVNTLISYAVLLGGLWFAARHAKEIGAASSPDIGPCDGLETESLTKPRCTPSFIREA
jgi:peptidoglycan biosynthesis protein MviN/MurJ (putative lipid II flippase)